MDDVEAVHELGGRELIAFHVGGQEFCIDIMAVRELRGWTPATPIPQAPAYVRGAINLRGTVLPVIDMGARIGLEPCEPGSRHVIIVVAIDRRLVGLLGDGVRDIIKVDEEDLQPTPEMSDEPLESFETALVDLEDRMVGLIALDQLLPRSAEAA